MDTPTDIRPPIGSIVVGVDGSEASGRAVVWATEQARAERRPLALVHVVPDRVGFWVGEPGDGAEAVLVSMRAEGRTLLAAARDSVDAPGDDLVVHGHLGLGDPRDVLLDLAGEAAMVVLGSRGRGPVASLLLGSVSVAVVQHARCPVVVLRPEDRGVRDGVGDVVVGLTTVRAPGHAVEVAFSQASVRSLPLMVVHGFWDPLLGTSGIPAGGVERQALLEEQGDVVDSLAALQEKFPDVAVSYRLSEGLPEDCLVAASHGGAMVVVGTLHPGAALSLLAGNVARSVTEHARCTVVVVPEDPIAVTGTTTA